MANDKDQKFTKKELKSLREENPHVELVDDKEALKYFNEEREEQERRLRGGK